MIEAQTKSAWLEAVFNQAVKAVKPAQFMRDVCADLHGKVPAETRHILAVGKAAGQMASGYFAAGGTAKSALIIVPYNVACTVPKGAPSDTKIIHAAHPVPNQASEKAARAALSRAESLGPEDYLICLLSGGGSALLSLGSGAITLPEKQQMNQALLASGAPIEEVNIVRKHLSAIKGGRLAKAAMPASVFTYALSDVPGDVPSAIASGPTVGDATTSQDALTVLKKYNITPSPAITKHLLDHASESPFPEEACFAYGEFHIVASAMTALQKIADALAAAGYVPHILGDDFQDDANQLALTMAEKAKLAPAGTALISGGEASVRVTGTGSGGRCSQFAHQMALLAIKDVAGIACDSDGIDGAAPVAGAYFDDSSLARAEALGLDAAAMLSNNDSHRFFKSLGDQIITGPTETNVNDLRIILVGKPQFS